MISRRRGILQAVGHHDLLAIARDLDEPLPAFALPPGIALRPATAADLPSLASTMEPFQGEIWNFRVGGPVLGLFQERLDAGDYCLIAERDDAILYMAWTRFDSASESEVGITVTLRPGEAYGYGVFTLPAFRGQGLATEGEAERLRQLRARGARRLYSWVSSRNTPIHRVDMRLGYRTVARVRRHYLRLTPRIPLLNHVVRRHDPLAEWCSPSRLSFHGGLSIFQTGRVGWSSGKV